MHGVISFARNTLFAVLALAGLFAALLIWTLWPLPNPRFDWRPYYQRLAAENCGDAARVLWRLIHARDEDAVRLAEALLAAKTCPELEGQQLGKYVAKAIERHKAAGGQRSEAYLYSGWEPGWPSIWERRAVYWREVQQYTEDYFIEGLGPWSEYPFAVISSWRCLMPYLSRIHGYVEAREILTRDGANPELRQTDWEERELRCFTIPALRPTLRSLRDDRN